MNEKGLAVLEHLLRTFPDAPPTRVIYSDDPNVACDYTAELRTACRLAGVPCVHRKKHREPSGPVWRLAVGWRWMLPANSSLAVIHDSLLPRYRGFSPLVSALMNREPRVGATALTGGEEFDRGDIIAQEAFTVQYPAKVGDVTAKMAHVYQRLAEKTILQMRAGSLSGKAQNEALATYSLWRDELDYAIDWRRPAKDIALQVDCLGAPYRGASTTLAGSKIRVLDTEVYPDVKIENRAPGKVIFIKRSLPVIVCGTGLLLLKSAVNDKTGKSALPLKRFRTRLGS